jgi:hypothetical protein
MVCADPAALELFTIFESVPHYSQESFTTSFKDCFKHGLLQLISLVVLGTVRSFASLAKLLITLPCPE